MMTRIRLRSGPGFAIRFLPDAAVARAAERRTNISRQRIIIFYAVAVISVASCRRQEPAAQAQRETVQRTTTEVVPQDLSKAKINTVIAIDNSGAVNRARVGATTDQAGLVNEDKTSFTKDDPVLISIWLNESPNGLQTSAKLLDMKGKQLAEQRKPMNGAKTTTFNLGKQKPGAYRVVGYWGGNIAGEFEIVVR